MRVLFDSTDGGAELGVTVEGLFTKVPRRGGIMSMPKEPIRRLQAAERRII
jgi:hypothetical protein